MRKNTLFFITFILFSFCISSVVLSKDQNNKVNKKYSNNIRNIASPNWVHPELRKKYNGYEMMKEQKQFSTIWQHSTNRHLGNIKGGGTTKYKNYTPFFKPKKK